MTNDFTKGLIMGLAMQPLQVTTEHADPDSSDYSTLNLIHDDFRITKNSGILGDVIVIDIPVAEGT